MAQVGRGHRFDIARDVLERMYLEERKSCREIGNTFGCSWSTVNARLREYGIPLRSSHSGWKQSPESNLRRSLAHKAIWDKRGRRTPEHQLHLQRGAWKARAKECYERDRWTCQSCQVHCRNNVKIQAHHILPRIRGGGDELDNLVTLCASCHTTAERALTQGEH